MKNKWFFLYATLFWGSITYAQKIDVDKTIDSYIVYIQDINTNEEFLPETTQKTIDIDGEKIEQDITYFSLEENKLFSIIVQSYGKPEVKTTYYFKDNKVITVFIEENNFSSNPKDKKYRNYFIKDDKIILEEPANSADDYQFFIHLGKGLAENYLKNK